MRIGLLFLFAAACLTAAEERVTMTGKVVDASGKPVDHATVMVYEAGVKKGYSVFCPTCWTDCGKHVITDSEGTFTIPGLNPDLWFTLLAMRDGYASTYVKKVDPAKGPAENAVLKPRAPIPDPSQAVRGTIVDVHGMPVKDAVIEQQGVTFKGPDGRVGTRFGGADDWIDALAVSNEKGEFELAFGKPAVQMILQVTPRGMAPKLFTAATGADRKTMTVTDGATIRGRLVYDGKPVANAEVGITTHARLSGSTYNEMRIGTREDGTFAITGVPAGRIWMVYPKMESLTAQNIGANAVPVETKDDGQEVSIGDIELKPACILRGRVVLSDGKPMPPDMHVTISADQAWDSQVVTIDSEGKFEFRGLPAGVFAVDAGLRGYHSPDRVTEVLVNRDIDNLVLRMLPGTGRP
jgi:hypothetical protein